MTFPFWFWTKKNLGDFPAIGTMSGYRLEKPLVETIAVLQGWLVLCILMVAIMPCRAFVV
jgi:hypothetical protein